MSHRMCVMCELASTVDVMPVGKSLNKFGLLSKDIYHDLHKSNMNEGIKWRGLLHSINFQENKLARLALIELIRIEKPIISEELEKSEHSGQISCICGLRTNGPRLKRSNSLSHIGDSSTGDRQHVFPFDQNQFSAFNDRFPRSGVPDGEKDERWKYMSLQPAKSQVPTAPKIRRRSRSLEILRPFTALERETFIPKDKAESSSESESMDDEIDYIFSGIASLNKDYVDEPSNEFGDDGLTSNRETHTEKTKVEAKVRNKVNSERPLDFDENYFSMSSGFPSTSSVDSVIHVTPDEDKHPVFAEESPHELEPDRDSFQDPKDESIGSPDMESTREEADVPSEGDITVTSSEIVPEDILTTDHEERLLFTQIPSDIDNNPTDEKAATSTNRNPVHNKGSHNYGYLDTKPKDENYHVLLIFIFIIGCLITAGLYFLPEPLISGVVLLAVLQLYTYKMR